MSESKFTRTTTQKSRAAPLVIAHRGASGLAPENTMAAFRLAMALGSHGIELDVHLSADGEPVVIHDARVNRTTNGIGQVANLRVDQLNNLDAGIWFDRRLRHRPRTRARVLKLLGSHASRVSRSGIFVGEPVPTLDSVLRLLDHEANPRVYIELKGPKDKERLLDAVLSVLRGRHAQNVTLLSFDHQIIARAKALAPELRAAATFPVARHRLISARSIIRAAREALADEVALHVSLATPRTVRVARESGLAVSAWTANRKLTMRRLLAAGVDAIMTNFPDRLIELIEQQKEGTDTAKPADRLSRK